MVKRFFFLFFFFSGLLKIALRCWDDLIYLKDGQWNSVCEGSTPSYTLFHVTLTAHRRARWVNNSQEHHQGELSSTWALKISSACDRLQADLNLNIFEVVPEVVQLKALPTEFQVLWAFMKIFQGLDQFQKSSYIIKMCWRPLTVTLKMAGISGRDRPVKASCRFETGLRRFDQVSDRWQDVRWV